MSQRNQPIRLALAALLAVASSSAARADCADLPAAFDHVTASGSAPAIVAANKYIQDADFCDLGAHACTGRALDGVIDAMSSTPNIAPPQDAVVWLIGKLKLSDYWRIAEWLSKYFDPRGDRTNAQFAYELAVSLSAQNPAVPATLEELRKLNNEAFAAKSLASYDAQSVFQTVFAVNEGRRRLHRHLCGRQLHGQHCQDVGPRKLRV